MSLKGASKMAVLDQRLNLDLKTEIIHSMVRWAAPGCAVVVVHHPPGGRSDSRILLFGRRDSEHPVTPDTHFPLASNSELITALALARALQSYGLSWQTPIRSILPEFRMLDKEAEAKLTVEDLLLHRSGVPEWHWQYGTDLADMPLLERWANLPSSCPRGEAYQYCSLGHDVLALTCQRLTGVPFDQYIKKNIIDPMDLRATMSVDKAEDMAVGYWEDPTGAGLVEVGYKTEECGSAFGAGRICTTPSDAVKLLLAMPEQPEWKDLSTPRDTPTEPTSFEYPAEGMRVALGLREADERGVRIIGNTGSIPGFSSSFAWVPEHHFAFAVLTNGDPGGHYLRSLVKCRLVEAFGGLSKLNWVEVLDDKRVIDLNPPKTIPQRCKTSTDEERGYGILGTWTHPSLPAIHIDESCIVPQLPQLKGIPFVPRLCGPARILWAAAAEKGWNGCVEWKAADGKVFHGMKLKAQLEEFEGDLGTGLKIIGLTDVAPGLGEERGAIVFRHHVA